MLNKSRSSGSKSQESPGPLDEAPEFQREAVSTIQPFKQEPKKEEKPGKLDENWLRDAQETTRLEYLEDQLAEELDRTVELTKKNSEQQTTILELKNQLQVAKGWKDQLDKEK